MPSSRSVWFGRVGSSRVEPVLLRLTVSPEGQVTVWDGELDAWIHGLIKVTAQLVGTPECPLPHKKAKHARYCTVRSCDRDECFVEPLEAR